VDPFQAFLGSKIDMHRANEVRPVLSELGKLAARHKCAFLMIRHLTKALHRRAILCGIGSVDVNAAARSVVMAAHSSNEDYVLTHAKCSNAPKGPSLGFQIRDGAIGWTGVSEVTAIDLLAGRNPNNVKPVREAESMLREFFADEQEHTSKELASAAAAYGISDRTLNRARRNLGVHTRPGDFQKQWVVILPQQVEQKHSEGAGQNGKEVTAD
jgi:hypothetical protein